ncbi:TspO/MBR family protein [Bengtsoniella intestinalis]|uniref:TspO/MBR family protein n=1 Tax=Bengtsoniella intestinalis TaxID=3073143 RepID=UPI00391F4BD2
MNTFKKHWKLYLLSILGALLIGALGSMATQSGMAVYDQAAKPPLTPPDWVFPVVWSVLYTLMGISFGRIFLTDNQNKGQAFKLYTLQLAGNFIWTVLFFGLHAYGLAFLWLVALWLVIALMALTFYRMDSVAGLLQIPYLLWVGFAGYLNLMIALLNR